MKTIKKWKYGLSLVGAESLMISPFGFPLYSPQEAQEYYTLVEICHDLVEGYLDAHPNEVVGFRYFDVLKKASPEYYQKVSEWSLDHKRRREEYTEKTKDWSIIYEG